MKNIYIVSTLLLLSVAPFAGCEKQSSPAMTGFHEQVNTEELARFLDFHITKFAIPESQQPFKGVQIVMIKPDGNIVPVAGTLGAEEGPSPYVLVGYRVEGETISGKLEYQTTKGSKDTSFSFTDPFAKRIRTFGTGPFFGPTEVFKRDGFWKDGILEIAADGPPTYASTNKNTIMAIKLVK